MDVTSASSHHKPHGSMLMKPIDKARIVLAALPRCTALSRQAGEQCKLAGTGKGGKCRFHGGASTGRPPIHGRYTKQSKLTRDWARLLLGCIVAMEGGSLKWFKPGRLSSERIEEIINKVHNRNS